MPYQLPERKRTDDGCDAAVAIRIIIFREECVFRKEIKYGDIVSINLMLIKGRRDFSRWTIIHEIRKVRSSHEASPDKAGSTLCAMVTVDGAWLNVVERKLFTPPSLVGEVFQQMPTGDHFEWQD